MATITELSKMNFDDKHSYLLWRDAWKTKYMEITNDVRTAKKNMKDPECDYKGGWQSQKHYLRVDARWMMEISEKAKEKSWSERNRLVMLQELMVA